MTHTTDTVRIGSISVPVPDGTHPPVATELAEAIHERLQEIEAHSPRVDTQAFALQAALEQALAAHELRQQVTDTNKQLLKALDEVATRLESLTKDFTKAQK